MKFNHSPHVNIEDHPYIQDLINKQEKRAADRTYHQERVKTLEERESLIKDATIKILTDFWCDVCKADFKGEAIKQVEEDWSASSQRIAFYKTKCWKGHWCIRFITDKHKDPYFFKSRFLWKQRGNFFTDALQPFEEGFNMVHGKK